MRIDTATSPTAATNGISSPSGQLSASGTFSSDLSAIRNAKRENIGTDAYGPDAKMRTNGFIPGKEELADARTVNSLEQRDRQVRQNEEIKGDAVAGSNFIYQTGPDGKRYAIGTMNHAVRPKETNGPSGVSPQLQHDESEMSKSDQALLHKLEVRDAKVRAHETAHIMAAGGQASSPTYTYQTGPDGKRYAIGGSVNISMLSTGDPESDARQAKNAHRAALATGEPSSRDMQTANKATALIAKAQKEATERYTAQSLHTPEQLSTMGKFV